MMNQLKDQMLRRSFWVADLRQTSTLEHGPATIILGTVWERGVPLSGGVGDPVDR
jgi:hypothetical protein